MKSKTSGLVAGILLACALLMSGCMQMAGVAKYDRLATGRAFQAQVRPGEVLVGVDLLAINTGYIAAWRAAPGEMALRTGGDLVATAAAAAGVYYGGKQAGWWGKAGTSDSASNATTPTDGPRVTTVNGHTININSSGSGSTTVIVSDDHSTAPPPEVAPPEVAP
jgi:hypothetical protein